MGSGLALAGAGCLLIASAYGQAPRSSVLGGNFPVNEGARTQGDASAHNSPRVVRNPDDPANLVVVDRVDLPAFGCGMHVSFDGGASFHAVDIPIPLGEPPKCYAPDAVFDSEGTLFVSFVTLEGIGNVPDAVWIVRSDDGGVTLSPPEQALGPLSFQVSLAAHPSIPERLYLSWLDAQDTATLAFPDTGYPVRMQVSEDGGRTWGPPVRVSAPRRERVVAPSSAVGPDGVLYLAYVDVGDDRLDYNGGHGGYGGPPYAGAWKLVVARSVDDGRSWEEVVAEEKITPTDRFLVFLPPFPSIVAGPARTVHAAFHDARLGDADVWVWTSRDGGTTWEEPVRVNDTVPGDDTSQYLPQLALSSDGRLDAMYYDRRNDADNVMNEVSLSSSYDGGRTFERSLRVSDQPFSSHVGFGAERNMPELGSRLGLLATEARSLALWSDSRNGTEASGKQDIMRSIVQFSDPPRLPGSLRTGLTVAGWALAALGAGVLVWALRRRTTPAGEAAP